MAYSHGAGFYAKDTGSILHNTSIANLTKNLTSEIVLFSFFPIFNIFIIFRIYKLGVTDPSEFNFDRIGGKLFCNYNFSL